MCVKYLILGPQEAYTKQQLLLLLLEEIISQKELKKEPSGLMKNDGCDLEVGIQSLFVYLVQLNADKMECVYFLF